MKKTLKTICGAVLGIAIVAIGYIDFKGFQAVFPSTDLLIETVEYILDTECNLPEDEHFAFLENIEFQSIQEEYDILEATMEGKKKDRLIASTH